MAITAPLGVNIPDSIDRISLGVLTDSTDWSFLNQNKIKLEVFGGNHVLEATKELLEEREDSIYSSFFTSKLCVVYYGLTDEEIQVVFSFVVYKFINCR